VNLKAELAARGLTQREVAKRMGITHTYLSKLINRRIPFTSPMALAFASVTGIPVEAIGEPEAVGAGSR
jgi:transcriptional regulator with XRE-family HTH domain